MDVAATRRAHQNGDFVPVRALVPERHIAVQRLDMVLPWQQSCDATPYGNDDDVERFLTTFAMMMSSNTVDAIGATFLLHRDGSSVVLSCIQHGSVGLIELPVETPRWVTHRCVVVTYDAITHSYDAWYVDGSYRDVHRRVVAASPVAHAAHDEPFICARDY